MRLIDADNFRRFAHEQLEGNKTYSIDEILEMIDEQPTAYDVDAVEEQLKQQAEQYRKRGFEHEQKGFSAMADKYYGKQCSYLHAIEIVRGEAE